MIFCNRKRREMDRFVLYFKGGLDRLGDGLNVGNEKKSQFAHFWDASQLPSI